MKYFENLFESIPDYRKIVLTMFLIQNVKDLLKECGVLKNDNNRLKIEFNKTLLEQNEDYLDHVKNQEEAVIERLLDK